VVPVAAGGGSADTGPARAVIAVAAAIAASRCVILRERIVIVSPEVGEAAWQIDWQSSRFLSIRARFLRLSYEGCPFANDSY
jgi:hypothetical protein